MSIRYPENSFVKELSLLLVAHCCYLCLPEEVCLKKRKKKRGGEEYAQASRVCVHAHARTRKMNLKCLEPCFGTSSNSRAVPPEKCKGFLFLLCCVVVVAEEKNLRIIKLFPLPEAKKTICDCLFACLFSTIKCKILLPVSGLYHMSPLVTKSACLLMSPIRGKDLEGLRELDSPIQYFCKGNFWLSVFVVLGK